MKRPLNHTRTVAANFDAEAPTWEARYRSGGSMAPRLARFAGALVERVPPPAPVLDFGCGTGALARALQSRGWQVTAADLSPGMLETAHQTDDSLELVQLTPDAALPFPDSTFSAIVASSVLEYLADPATTFREFRRILRPGGWLLATVPDPSHSIRRRERMLLAISRLPGAAAVLATTKCANYFSYLRLSVNRMPMEEWHVMLRRAEFACDPTSTGTDPLALLTACRGPSS